MAYESYQNILCGAFYSCNKSYKCLVLAENWRDLVFCKSLSNRMKEVFLFAKQQCRVDFYVVYNSTSSYLICIGMPCMYYIKAMYLSTFCIIHICPKRYIWYTPRPNRAVGSIQWTNTFDFKILKYTIKNATLPNILACTKPFTSQQAPIADDIFTFVSFKNWCLLAGLWLRAS